MSIPGIGLHIATAIVIGVGNSSSFTNTKELAVWTGLTPGQISNSHKSVLVGIKNMIPNLAAGLKTSFSAEAYKKEPLQLPINKNLLKQFRY
jgi:transposase